MLTERFDNALRFALDLHRKQSRKGTNIPYITHLLAVASLVAENGGTEDEAIAGLLHDAIEDQGKQYPGGREALRLFIESKFGQTVLEIINGCTDDEGRPKGEASSLDEESRMWRDRKRAYLDHLRTTSDSVRRVSCADKLHNLRTILADYLQIGDQLWNRFRTKSRDDQFWCYGELVRVFRETNTGPLAVQLEMTWLTLAMAASMRVRESTTSS